LFDIAGRGQIIALATIHSGAILEHSREFFKEIPLPLDNGLGSADSGTHLTLELALEGLRKGLL
jgi:hypothetical protein